MPTELKKDARALGKDLAFDEAQEGAFACYLILLQIENATRPEPSDHVDSEYSRAGIDDPKILITTSRDPSSKLLQFAKVPSHASFFRPTLTDHTNEQEMRLVFPNSNRLNRGNYVVRELAAACRANGISDLIILHEHRGTPDALILSHFPHGPTLFFSLHNVQLRHDIKGYNESTVSEQYPHLVFESFESSLGKRVRDALRFLFPVPKEDSKRVMTFANEDDFISFGYIFLFFFFS